MDYILGILSATWYLFIEMSPYLILGLLFVGILNAFVTKDLVSKHLGKNNYSSIFKGAAFGIPLPLCSCGVIPTAVFMKQNNASKGAVTSFLISTPQTGIDSIAATYGMMGPIFAIFRPIAALFMGIIGGAAVKIISPDKPRNFIGLNVIDSTENIKNESSLTKKFLHYPFREFLDDIAPQFLVGLLIAGVISFVFPDSFFKNEIFENSILSMLIMIIAGIPMYICATASIPIAVAMMLKGLSPGAAFVFLAVGPATNAASFSILSKSLGKKVTVIYITSIAITAILFGWILDQLFNIFSWNIADMLPKGAGGHTHDDFGVLTITSAIILGALLIISVYNIYLRKLFINKNKIKPVKDDAEIIQIKGMTCSHCENTVKNALQKAGNEVYSVDHVTGTAQIRSNGNQTKNKKVIEEAGYDVIT